MTANKKIWADGLLQLKTLVYEGAKNINLPISDIVLDRMLTSPFNDWTKIKVSNEVQIFSSQSIKTIHLWT